MKITCNCLNFIIQGKGDKCGILDKALKNILSNDAFFKEEIGTVEQVEIKIKLPNIIEAYRSGPWIIHRCLNCGVYVYASNQEADANTIIVNCALTTDDAKIAALKKSECYSPMFGIIVDYKEVSESTPGTGDEDLDQKLKQWIEQQKILTEERVQAYIEQQYTELEKSKAIALREHIAISRIVSKKKISPKVTPVQITKNPLKEIQASYEKGDNILNNERLNPNRTSFDSEGLFPLDDIDESSMNDRYDIIAIPNESENNDENVQIPRREDSGHFARSLPVPVPQFMQDRKQNESNSGSPNVPTDIAASIKALAKSVHGDAVFGELPRPRFSTHL